MKRAIIVLILIFPVVSLAWFCYWGFNQPRTPFPPAASTDRVTVKTNDAEAHPASTNVPRP